MSVIEDNQVCQINDINFTVGATAISVQQENLAYKFHAIRHRSSTKIPTGHGSNIVLITIQIPREDVLKLHRLIIQSKRNSYIYIENKFIRHKIVPHWSKEQVMAFSLLNLNVENVIGQVGLFTLTMQLSWFNYFPFTHNFLFREEWETDWMKSTDSDTELQYFDLENIRYVKRSIFGYITQYWAQSTLPLTGWAGTFEDRMKDWSGFINNLLPVPSGMKQAQATNNPKNSKIYVRYYNELQAQALKNNFYIDLKDDSYLGEKDYYLGLLSGTGNNSGYKTLPEYLDYKNLSSIIIEKMLSFDYFNLIFRIYKYVDLPPSMVDALSANSNSLVENRIGHDEALINSVKDSTSEIPQEIKDNIVNWTLLLNCNPLFRIKAIDVLIRMIRGDTLSGTKYINNKLKISETFRNENATYGSPTSLHKIKAPDGKPDSFALDLGLVNTGNIGNHLEKVDQNGLIQELEIAKDIQVFHFDYGYIVNLWHKGGLIWGGNFSKGYDSYSTQITPLRISNSNYLLGHTAGEIVRRRNDAGLGPPPSNYFNCIYPSGTPGNDHVHIQYYFSGSSSSVYNKLQSGWRPNQGKTPIYNETEGTFVNSDGDIKPWYSVFDTLGSSALVEADTKFFIQLDELRKSGWKYYSRDNSVNGIFYKDVEVTVPSSSGNIQLGPEGFLGNADGSSLDLDTVLHKVSGTINHIVVSLPVIGHEYPVHQHLGSVDAQYNFEFLTTDKIGLHDGLGKTAQLIESARIALQQNGRNLRVIYNSWMADADNFITRLFGTFYWFASYPSEDPQFEKKNNSLFKEAKKVIISSTQTSTVPGNAGLSSFMLQCEETQPFVSEQLIKSTQVSASDYDNIYRKIIKKIKEISVVTSEPFASEILGQIQNKQKGFFETIVSIPSSITNAVISTSLVPGETLDQKAEALRKRSNSVGLNYLKLDTSKVSDLTSEEQEQLRLMIISLGLLASLGQCLLFEKDFGGLSKVSGSPITYDLYGFENYINPHGKLFLDYSFSQWSWLSKEVLRFILRLAAEGAGMAAGAAAPVLSLGTTGYYIGNGTGSDIATIVTTIQGGLLGLLLAPAGAFVGASAGFFSSEAIENTSFDENLWREVVIVSYLKEIAELTGGLDVAFVSATSDYLAGIINSFFSFDNSPLAKEEEVYGLASSARLYIDSKEQKIPLPNLSKEEFENNKAELLKSVLATTLRSIFNNPALLSFFEIEEDVALLYQSTISDERDALPDLNLPNHPFWGKSYLTPPDFYYFNYHEDGQYSNSEYLKRVYTDPMKSYIDGTYDFMSQLKNGGISISGLTGDLTAFEIHGFYDGSNDPADPDLINQISSEKDPSSKIKTMGYTSPNPETGEPDTLTFNKGKNSCNFLGSNFDRDAIYTPLTTNSMIEKIKTIEAQFGKKEGFANEREEIAKVIPTNATGLNEENKIPSSFTHFYGKEDLYDIAQESLGDLLSQTFTMKRAWPTYRLYIIEEDQTEDFLIRYDDFYHYNSIREITIVRSREVSADMAIISMQNISGVLDGSKRLSIKDTDFLLDQRGPTGELSSKGKKIEESRKTSNLETKNEETFNSVVLRPGVNIQIRMGYGNNPNNLEVKLSGRIVDVMFSENSDLVEITVQSFGAELEQQQKGLIVDNDESYNLTHKLLGSLMFSPELQHFGRFERGTQFQFGENKDSNLDFRDYTSTKYKKLIDTIYFGNTSKQINDLWTATTDFSPWGILTKNAKVSSNVFETKLALGWDVISGIMKSSWNIGFWGGQKTGEVLKNSLKEKFSYALASPQDDNLFPPNPKDYLMRPNWIFAVAKDAARTAWWDKNGFSLSSAGNGLTRLLRNIVRAKLSPKLELEELLYTPQGSTIFQIFHEMTLRHPGYVYSAMPYGNDFRYTMFFGVPSQRYWCKPAHPAFISRTNKIRKAISTPMADELTLTDKKSFSDIDQVHTISEFRTYLKQSFMSQDSFAEAQFREAASRASTANGDTKTLSKLGITSLSEALLQYYQALTLRFVPFRRYHLSTSETDIISNGISVSDYDVANAVAVKYYSAQDKEEENQREQEDVVLVKIHDAIPDDQVRLKQVSYPNIGGENLALRYGVGELVYQAKQMYQGSLLLLGNPRVKPWDIIYIIDKYNDMAGPVEVEQIVEKFSFETGYVIDVKPNAVVFANEISSFPIIEGIKAAIGAITYEQDKFYTSFKGNEFFNFLTTNSGVKSTIESINEIVFDGEALNGRSVQDISEYAQGEISSKIGLPSITQSSEEGPNNMFVPSQTLTPLQSVFMSGAWLLGGMLYVNKCSYGQNVIVYPLIKSGIPFIAGIPSGRPETIWSIFRGQIKSFTQDITKGTVDYLSYWKLLGTESLKAFTIDSSQLKRITEASSKNGG